MDEGKSDLAIQLADLKKNCKEIENASALVQVDISKVRKSIETNEERIKIATQNIDEVQVRIALLQARSRRFDENSRICDELSQRIRKRSEKWKKSKREEDEKTYYSKQNRRSLRMSQGSTNTDLETECNRKLRQACEQIVKMRRQHLLNELSEEQSEYATKGEREHLWTKLEELLADFQAQETIQSLIQNTMESTNILLAKTNRVDLAKDAEDLRFKFESGKLKDASEQPAILQSVDQLIEQGQSEHFQRFLEAEKAKNDVWRGKKRFEKAQQLVNNALQKKYGASVTELNLKRRMLNLETELYGLEASIGYLSELINDLNCQSSEKKKTEEVLQEKYRKIQEFESRAQNKQLIIQSLVKQNGSARSHLEQQQAELLKYIDSHICAIGNEIGSSVDIIKDNLRRETKRFTSMKMSQLKTMQLDSGLRIPCDELSIHRFGSNSQPAVKEVLDSLSDGMQFQSYLAPEELFSKIKELKETEMASTSEGKQDLFTDGSSETQTKLDTKINALKERCIEYAENAEKKRRETVPKLERNLTKTTDALKDCLQLEKMIHTWWDQPAQFFVPWVKEDGMNLRQWYTHWEVNSARLAQMQLSR